MIMTNPLKMMVRLSALCGAVLVASMLTGCQTTSTGGDGAFAQVPGMPGNASAVPQAGSTAEVAVATQPAPGASTNSPFSSDILRINDSIKVIFSDLPIPQPPFEERVKEDGTITLLQNQTFNAAGKSRGELEKEIRARYVPGFFKNLTVTIQPQERFYFVDGEVKNAQPADLSEPHDGAQGHRFLQRLHGFCRQNQGSRNQGRWHHANR